jgi:microcystin-dependent protein
LATSNKNFKVKNGLDVNGAATANSFVKNGGTSVQFLKADGSVSEGSSAQVSQTPPSSPAEGDIWFNSSNTITYIYYDGFWIEANPSEVGPTGPMGEPGIVASEEEPLDTNVLWLDTDEDGVGIPIGGTAGQVLAKIDSGSFNTEWVDTYTPEEIDDLLDNKSDVGHLHDDRYYTEAETDNAISTAVSNLVDSSPALLDTLNELSAALNDDPNFSTTVANALAALVPSGTINQTARATAPAGYLLCDGSAISRTTYSSLFDAIGTAYGAGDNSTTFNIPNLRGRVPVGFDSSQTEFDTLGEIGGAKTHTLTSAEMPSHTHIQDSHNHIQNSHNHTQNAHSHTFSATTTGGAHTHAMGMGIGGGAAGAGDYPMRSNGAYDPNFRTQFEADGAGYGSFQGGHQHSISGTTSSPTATNNATTATNQATTATNQNTGGGGAHNNLQPYVVLNYMIKI